MNVLELSKHIKNPNADLKAKCLNCHYLNPKSIGTYKCYVLGHCPAKEILSSKLSKEVSKAFDEFDKCAKDLGYQEDQGSEKAFKSSEEKYLKAKEKFLKLLEELSDKS